MSVETHVRSLAAARLLSVCRSQTLDDKRRYRHHWKHVRSESSPLSYEDVIVRDKHNHAVITLACRAVHATVARDDDGAPASSRGNRDQKCIALFFVIVVQVEYEELSPIFTRFVWLIFRYIFTNTILSKTKSHDDIKVTLKWLQNDY